MPESSQAPHPPVSTAGRMLATVVLLHGSGIDGSGIDRDTATAVIDAVAYLTITGDTDGAHALIRLVTTDPGHHRRRPRRAPRPRPPTEQHRSHRRTTAAATPAHPPPLSRPREARPRRGKRRDAPRDRCVPDDHHERPETTARRHSRSRRGRRQQWHRGAAVV